jgi:hypothetical protein
MFDESTCSTHKIQRFKKKQKKKHHLVLKSCLKLKLHLNLHICKKTMTKHICQSKTRTEKIQLILKMTEKLKLFVYLPLYPILIPL